MLKAKKDSKKDYCNLEDNYVCVSDMVHGFRVATLALKICDKLKITDGFRHEIFISGIFHDIGKAAIEAEILTKPGTLTNKENNRVKFHAVLGAQIAFDAKFSDEVIRNINYHHEKWDGTGYPLGKKGDDIPLGARIIKVCDVYDALTSDRPYRKAYTKEEAIKIMEQEVKSFDSKIFKALKEVLEA